MCTDGARYRSERGIPRQMPVGVVDDFEMINVYQGNGNRAARAESTRDLRLRLILPGGGIEEPGLGIHPGLCEQWRVHHEPPRQEHRGHRAHREEYIDPDDDRRHHAEIDLREVGLQRLPVQLQLDNLRRRIGELDRDHQQDVVDQPACQFTHRDGEGPGKGVRARADRMTGEGRGAGTESQRGRTVGNCHRASGEDPAVNDSLVHHALREPQQRNRHHHRIDGRQEDGHRQHPYRQEVSGHPAFDVGSTGRRGDRGETAA
jgi:hypothetical protein